MRNRLKQIQDRIANAAIVCGRDPEDIRLVAVSKTVPTDAIRTAFEAGQPFFGESYIQEAIQKIQVLGELPITWHFIGHLQSRKASQAVRWFDLIHSVDSLKLAGEIDREAAKLEKIQQILIQVNLGEESTKSGVRKDEAMGLVEAVSRLAHVRIKGLMTLPPFFDEPERARPFFAALRELGERIQKEGFPGVCITELSMGMSGDFEVAVQEGATWVRIGTLLFGERGKVVR